jgi:hypothetical protein
MRVAMLCASIVIMFSTSAYIIYSVYWLLFPLPGFVIPLKQAAEAIEADFWSLDQIIEDCTTEPAKWHAYVKDKSKQNHIHAYGKTPEEAVAAALLAIKEGRWERLCTVTTLKSYSIVK